MRTLAIPLLVFKLTGSAFNLGGAYGTEFFAWGLFSVIGGSLADRLDRRRLMIACDAVRFVILAIFALDYVLGRLTIPMIYVGLFVHAACGAIFNYGMATSIPYVLGKDRATSAVAILEGTFQSVQIIAPPIGAALFGLIGPQPALEINALTYLVSISMLSFVHDLGPEEALGLPRLRELVEDVRWGLRFIFDDRAMRIMTCALFVANTAGTIGITTLVPFIERELRGSHVDVGIAFGAMGLGSATGALLAARYQQPFGLLAITGYLGDGVAWIPLAFTSSLLVASVALGLASMCGMFATGNLIGWRMRVAPEGAVGRVFGASRLVILAGMLPGSLIGGALAERFGARISVEISFILFIAMGLALLVSPTMRAEAR